MEQQQQTSWLNRYLPYILLIGIIVSLVIYIKWQHDLAVQRQEDAVVQMKDLKDQVVRAQAALVSKEDLEDFAKKNKINLGPIEEDLAKLHAEVRGINQVLTTTNGYNGTNLPSTGSVSAPGTKPPTVICNGSEISCPDPYGYFTKVQQFSLIEPFKEKKVPFGQVEFRTWEKDPWSLAVYPRTYSTVSVLGEDENGRHYTYNKFSITVNGQTYPLDITNAKYIEEKPPSKFRFSPRLYLSVNAGGYLYPVPKVEVSPDLEVAFFSYGRTKANPSWMFLGVGMGYGAQTKSFTGILTPAAYNIGQHLPLVNNLYLGASLIVGTNGGIGVMGGLRVGL